MAESREPGPLECPICFENMISKKPRFLRCHHSFCEACLLGIANSNEKRDLTCPTCRYKTPINKGGVAKLPLDFTLQGMKDELQKSRRRCDVCICRGVRVDASYRCLDCNQQFCEDCLLLHIDRYSSHTSIPIIAQGVNCAQHDQVVRYFCRTCSKYICPFCALDPSSEHQRHQVSPLSKEFDSFRIEFYNMRSTSEAIKENMQQYKSTMEKSLQQYTMKTDVIEELIGNVDSDNETTQELLESKMKEMKGLLASVKLEIQQRCCGLSRENDKLRTVLQSLLEIQQRYIHDIENMKTTVDNCDSRVYQCACSLKSLRENTSYVGGRLEQIDGRLFDHTTSLKRLKDTTGSMEVHLKHITKGLRNQTESVQELKNTVQEQTKQWFAVAFFSFCLIGLLIGVFLAYLVQNNKK